MIFMNITIKKMESEEEIKGKAFVAWRAWHETYPGLVSQEYLDNLTLEKCEEVAFRLTDGFLVAKDKGRVIGFIGYGVNEDGNSETGEIFALYILSEYYGKGVGSQLMEAALKQLDRYSKVCLWVLKNNKRAIRFYQKCGFYPDGEEKFSPRVSATGIRMTLWTVDNEGKITGN